MVRGSLPTKKIDTTPLLERLSYMLPPSLCYDFTWCPFPSGFKAPLKLLLHSPQEPFELGDRPRQTSD